MQQQELVREWTLSPEIIPVFYDGHGAAHLHHYSQIIRATLRNLLPEHFFSPAFTADEKRAMLQKMVPLFTWSEYRNVPFQISFHLMAHRRPDVHKFFSDILTRWLVPGKRFDVLLLSALDFRLPEWSEEIYTLMEVVLPIESEGDLIQIRRNLPVIESEVRLGAVSTHHAKRILEVKGLTGDEKTAMIQENVAYVLRRRGGKFGKEVFTELQHFLVHCGEPFRAAHSSRHMSRLVCVQYYFRKMLREWVVSKPQRRHLAVKLLKTQISPNAGPRRVLGIFVGVNLLRPNEVFEQKHLLGAVAHYVPHVRPTEHSLLVNRPRDDTIHTLYLEVEKSDGTDFSAEEMKRLRRGLPSDLKGRIEHQMHSVFMPQNEEEIMRHILTLSKQLKYVRDLPQVVINFQEQTDLDLIFIVIVVRVLHPHDGSILSALRERCPHIRCLPDLIKVVGQLRKKYTKEANVFRICLQKDAFLRGDHSLDLFQARKKVVEVLQQSLGEIRDFNGGMIAKQEEVLSELRKSLGALASRWDWLLENFFHGMRPVVMRSLVDSAALKRLFLMLAGALDEREYERTGVCIKIEEDAHYLYLLMVGGDSTFRDAVLRTLESLAIPAMRLTITTVRVAEAHVLGILYHSDEMLERAMVMHALDHTFLSGPWQPQETPSHVALY